MINYILIIFLTSSTGVAMEKIQFNSLQGCIDAKTTLINKSSDITATVRSLCIEVDK